MNIYLGFVKHNDKDPVVDVYTDVEEAIEITKNKLFNQCQHRDKIREFEVVGCSYFGVNLLDGMMAWVEVKDIAPRPSSLGTSSVTLYSFNTP